MPLPMESPKTLIVVRNLHKDRRSKALKHSIAAILDRKPTYNIQHGRDLETWYLEAGRDLETSEADTEVGVL